ADKFLFLFDYELLNQSFTGLDLIEKLAISKKSILVTSYYEDPKVKERTAKIKLRLIPKSIAAFIPII
ncbi:hypothetical protein ACXYUI_32175, partial [Klebsiella pneumoniae]